MDVKNHNTNRKKRVVRKRWNAAVLSELDSSRQNYLLDSISDIQTLITCTGLDDFISHQFQINKVFQVVQGTVSQPV